MRRFSIPFARLAFFVVYFYFGLLKVLGVSPAAGIVHALWQQTIPFIPFDAFIVFFGGFEMALGIIFLIPGWERPALYLLIPHLITTAGPLVFLPEFTWKGFLVPTLAGHYILKNLGIIALMILVAVNAGTFRSRQDPKHSAFT